MGLHKFITSLSTPFWTGISAFLGLILFCIHVYKNLTNLSQREEHKKIILVTLEKFSKVNLKEFGKNAAILFSRIMNSLFGQPTKNDIFNFTYWNEKTFFIISYAAMIAVVIATLIWGLSYHQQRIYLDAPSSILMGASIYFLKLLHNQKKKGKVKDKNRSHTKTKKGKNTLFRRFRIYFENSSILNSGIATFLGLIIFVTLYWMTISNIITLTTGKRELFFKTRGYLVLIYGGQIFLTVLSFVITRVLLQKIIINTNIMRTIKITFVDVLISIVISIFSFIFASEIIEGTIRQSYYLSEPSFKIIGSTPLQLHFYVIFFIALFPSILFLIFSFFEISLKVFAAPFQKLVVIVFEKIIKSNLYLYLFSIILVVLAVQLINIIKN